MVQKLDIIAGSCNDIEENNLIMKIRALTVGFNVAPSSVESRMERIGRFISMARAQFERSGFEVQTTRIVSQPWVEYLSDLRVPPILDYIKRLEYVCKENGVDLCSIGTAYDPKHIRLLSEIVASTNIVSASATIAGKSMGINHDATLSAARTIIRISKTTRSGDGNFRFAAIANCPADIPFFPASYHHGRTCFTIALESSDLLSKAFDISRNLVEAERNLRTVLEGANKRIEKLAKRIERKGGIFFRGIDVSPAPSMLRKDSIAVAFEKLGLGAFGAAGTLAIAGMITKVLKSLDVRRCGFSGLMLPVMEDYGLAARINDEYVDIQSLLAYSAVCGTGLDCIPLPGAIPTKKIYAILLDMATLAVRIDKPLSARLLPMPGKRPGSVSSIDSPYLLNCRIPKIK